MNELQDIHSNSLYYEFMLIEDRAYREKIKFFERNKKEISDLKTEYETEVWYYYTIASFEIGDYKKYIQLSQIMLERVIEESVISYGKEDVFQQLLFNRAASYLNLKQYKKAEHIFKELIKIDPKNKLYSKAFYQNRFLEHIKDSAPLKLFTAVMLITIVILCIVEMLIMQAFYPEAAVWIAFTRNTLSLSMFAILFLHAGYHYVTAKQALKACLLSKKTYL